MAAEVYRGQAMPTARTSRAHPGWFGKVRHKWGAAIKRAVINDPVLAALMMRYVQDTSSPNAASSSRKIAIGSAQRLMANIASTMPWGPYRINPENGFPTQVTNPSVFWKDPDGMRHGLGDWMSQIVWSLAYSGNAMGHIVALDPITAYPTAIVPIHPDKIKPTNAEGGLGWKWQIEGGRTLEPHEVMHLRLFPVPGQILGLSPIEQHAQTIGVAISAERFGGNFFDSDGHPTGLLESPDDLDATQAERIKQKFRDSSQGRDVVMLPSGVKYQAIQVKPDESQFLDTQKLTNAECARIYGPGVAEILGYDTAGAMTYQNVSDRDLHLLKYAANKYLCVIEDWLTAFATPNGQTVHADREAMLAMNPIARAQRWTALTGVGAIVPNEIRKVERIGGPVAWGDKPYPITQLKETETLGPDGKPVAPIGLGAEPAPAPAPTPAKAKK